MATNTPLPGKIADQSRKLTLGSIIELFRLDASKIPSSYTGMPGPVFAFHNCNLQGTEPLSFGGVLYQPYPFKTQGYDVNSQGKLPRPTLTVANIGGVFSSLLREYDDLSGAVVTRLRTLFQYLDYYPGTTTPMPTSDPLQVMPEDVFYIDRKSAETKTALAFELSANFDVQGVMLPRRQLTANACTNLYRAGDGCDYTGLPVTDQYGTLFGTLDKTGTPESNPNYGNFIPNTHDKGAWDATKTYQPGQAVYIEKKHTRVYYVALNGAAANLYPPFNQGVWTTDTCQKTLTACRCRYGMKAVLPFMAFPAIIRAPLSPN